MSICAKFKLAFNGNLTSKDAKSWLHHQYNFLYDHESQMDKKIIHPSKRSSRVPAIQAVAGESHKVIYSKHYKHNEKGCWRERDHCKGCGPTLVLSLTGMQMTVGATGSSAEL